jgi:predicted kinase
MGHRGRAVYARSHLCQLSDRFTLLPMDGSAPELVILIGLQASGKSTFRRMHFDATHVIVSKDLFRNNRAPQRRQMLLVAEALSTNRSVVVDNTNPERKDREALIEVARRFDARVRGFFLDSVFEECLQRNHARAGKSRVPDVGLYATAKVMRKPSYDEGFDELYLVRMGEPQQFVVEAFSEGMKR